MTLLYCTADSIGQESGGGKVSAQELLALRELSEQEVRRSHNPAYSTVEVFSREYLDSPLEEPWKWDEVACNKRDWFVNPPQIAHFYSGTFGKTVWELKQNGTKVVYTIAAHDREVSRKEHEKLGLPFPYPHLVEEKLWQRYVEGYRIADVLVCPSSVAANTIRNYGGEFAKKDIRIIPHGCHLPTEVRPLPKSFIVGYAGSLGADKGVRYLLEAWKKLAYLDGSLLILAGRDSTSPFARHLLNTYGGGSVQLAGWQKNMTDFYNSITCFVCPAATEGFNLEVLEALAHGRPVLCSEGAGAQDLVPREWRCMAGNAQELADAIHTFKRTSADGADQYLPIYQKMALPFTWDRVREMYRNLWTEVLK